MNAGARRVIIVGAGIGGLTAAIALRRAGLDVQVFEKRSDPQMIEVGGGMVLWTNAMRALQKIEMADGIQAGGQPLERFEWCTPAGKQLAFWPVGNLARQFGAPTVGVRRMNLQGALVSAIDSKTLRLGAEVVDVVQDDSGVTVRLASGEEERGDVVVGADGINSTVRAQQLYPWTQPRYAGYALWFGLTKLEAAQEPTFREIDGRGARFIFFPVGDGNIYWSAIANAPEGANPEAGGEEIAQDREMLLQRYSGWAEPTHALIAATDSSSIYRREIADRDPVKRWSEGRCTLLGDAAHAMTINLGQGACQAIEDAVVLANCLGSESDSVLALRAYEEKRIRRTASFVRRSRTIGAMGRWKSPLACGMRGLIQRVVFPTVALRDLKQTMAYEP